MYFVNTNSLNKKILFSFYSVLIFIIGLSAYYVNRNYVGNFKSYYLLSYFYAGTYLLDKTAKFPAQALVYRASDASKVLFEDRYAQSIPVLLYHGLLDNEPGSEASNVNLATFWDQMRSLKEAGWQTVTVSDFYDFMNGKKKLPAKSFVLTFDDGRKDSYYPGDPLIRALGFNAVMFVIDQYSLEEESRYYLSKSELDKMQKSGHWEIQSHGYSSHSEYPLDAAGSQGHFFSNKLWISELGRIENDAEFIVRTTRDLQKSKEDLEKAFDKPVIAFAFPSGDYGQGTVNFPNAESVILPEVLGIYPLVFYQYSSVDRFSQNYYVAESNPKSNFFVKRIGISPKWSGHDLLNIFEAGSAKLLPFNAQFSQNEGWINTDWGTMKIADGTLSIAAIPSDTGSTVVLDGSRLWTDYVVTAKVNWLKGSNIYLSSRYQDDNNLAACNYGRSLVHVEQIVGGKQRVIAGAPAIIDPSGGPITISMRVTGRQVVCSVNGETIASTSYLDPSLSSGGITIKSWDNKKGNSELEVLSLTVELP